MTGCRIDRDLGDTLAVMTSDAERAASDRVTQRLSAGFRTRPGNSCRSCGRGRCLRRPAGDAHRHRPFPATAITVTAATGHRSGPGLEGRWLKAGGHRVPRRTAGPAIGGATSRATVASHPTTVTEVNGFVTVLPLTSGWNPGPQRPTNERSMAMTGRGRDRVTVMVTMDAKFHPPVTAGQGQDGRGCRNPDWKGEPTDAGEKGDWLVVESSVVDRSGRRGLILDAEGPDGTPPFLVRWEDNGHEGLVFPGPDAHVAAAGSAAHS